MKILNKEQIKAADAYTIAHEPITSIDLMERASARFVALFTQYFSTENFVQVVCGLGNNGGDGLAIARMLYQQGYDVSVSVIRYGEAATADFEENLKRLEHLIEPTEITEKSQFSIKQNAILIDALFGIGLARPLAGLAKAVVLEMNYSKNKIVAVDVPSGLYIDTLNVTDDTIIKASFTFTFELMKHSFLFKQNEFFVGKIEIIPIGLHPEYLSDTPTNQYFTTESNDLALLKTKSVFSHKGTFGHALLLAGSYGMMGAAVLGAKAALRSGLGKLTVAAPPIGYSILQTAVPEAMFQERNKNLDYTRVEAIGIGPGLGNDKAAQKEFIGIFDEIKNLQIPLIMDADALNCLAQNTQLIPQIPRYTIITPHPKEFERLIGRKWEDEMELQKMVVQFAIDHQIIVCLKGRYTQIAVPTGESFFNSTGNVGMATAGSGDVLTGIILAFLAQGYTPQNAAIIGVFEHGKAGDRAAENRSERSMIASDIVEWIR